MSALWPLVFRSIMARKQRSLLTAIAVALGVAVMIAVYSGTQALQQQSEFAANQRAGQSGLDVRAAANGGLDPNQLQRLARLSGIQQAVPLYTKRVQAQPADPHAQAVTVTLIGIRGGQVALRNLNLIAGSLPAASSHTGVVIDKELQTVFEQNNRPATVGDHISLNTSTGPDVFTIAGISDQPAISEAFTRDAIALPESELLSAFDLGLRTPLVALKLAPGYSASQVANEVHKLLGNDVTTFDPTAVPAQPLGQIATLLLMLTMLSVLIGSVVTANSVFLSTLERRREIGSLRAAGASSTQVFEIFLAEAVILSAGGALAGILIGTVGAAAVIHYFAQGPAQVSGFNIDVASVILFAAVGMAAAALGAAIPAIAAGRQKILQALRDTPAISPEKTRDPRSSVLGLWLLALVFGFAGGGWAIVGVCCFLIGLALLLPILVPTSVQLLAAALQSRWPQIGVAAATIKWRGTRNALAVSGLVVAIAVMVASSTLVAGSLSASDTWISRLFIGPTLVRSPVTESDSVAASLARDSGNVTYTELRIFPATINGDVVAITALNSNDYQQHSGLDLSGADRGSAFAQLRAGPAVFVPASLASAAGWNVNAELSAVTPNGNVDLRVVAVAAHSLPGGDGRESLIMDASQARQIFGPSVNGFDDLEILTPNHTTQVQHAAVKYGLSAVDLSEILSSARNAVFTAVGLLVGLSIIAVIVAILAVINTLAVTITQDTRSVALLRAIGISRRQGFLLLMAEAFLLVVTASVIGLLAGLIITIPMLHASATAGFGPDYNVPAQVIAAIIVAAIAGILFAAAFPARRVMSVSVAAAVHYE